MRMRKDTGFFRIRPTDDGEAMKSVLPNLSAEDFIGEIVEDGEGGFTAVTAASDNAARTEVTFTAGETSYTYTRATGAIEKVSNESDSDGE